MRLLAAIGIAGMDRALMANIIAKSGKAVELAGDIDTLLLDKTGTITLGNRKATQFVPLGGVSAREVARVAGLSSLADQTPEGKSILDLARQEAAVGSEAPEDSHVRRIHRADPHERYQSSRRHAASQRRARHRREVRVRPRAAGFPKAISGRSTPSPPAG